ncbi:hypothetical protein R1flu_020876 [Riccia fluitans]|uniref:FHA domain-containing protein n=1 Tax=Riccia fluitans TaxID=41844 RepID=A0ABD1ZMR8_9MARC
MEGKEADLVDPFFDSEEDESVDMEMVREAMKHVPLPDIDYPEHDDPFSSDPSTVEHLSPGSIAAVRDRIPLQGLQKRKADRAKTEPLKRKGGGTTGRAPKRVKVEAQGTEHRTKLTPKQPVKAENLVGSVRAAQAKVAAEVAPNVFTGGIVAETGPRPDFSLWTVDDDLLLKNAMEAGAAMEALGKGAMRFSRRFTLRELRERWRALLYDPEIAAQAAARMVEAELATTKTERPKASNEQKTPKELARKRRANSIRTLYYKKRKKAPIEMVTPGSTNGLAGNEIEDVSLLGLGTTADMTAEQASKHLFAPSDFMAMGLMGKNLLDSISPKETTTLDFEDQSFSQMFSLLAAGGVRAVIGANAGMHMESLKQDLGVLMDDVHSRVNMATGTGDIFEPATARGADMASAENEAVPEPHLLEGMVIDSCAGIHTLACESDEEATITIADIELDARLQASDDCSKMGTVGARNNLHFDTSNGSNLNSAGGYEINAGLHLDGTVNEVFKEQSAGVYAPSHRKSHSNAISSITSVSHNVPVSVDAAVESMDHLKSTPDTNFPSLKADVLCETSLVSVIDIRDGPTSETKLPVLSPVIGVECSLPPVTDSTHLQEPGPWAVIDGHEDVHLEEFDNLEGAVERCCECGRLFQYIADHDTSEEDLIHNEQNFLAEEQDNLLPSVLTGESSTLDYTHEEDTDVGLLAVSRPGGIENPACSLNTEDTDDIPNLDDVLPYPPSPSPPLSPSEEEYLAMLESPLAGPEGDGDAAVEAEGVQEHLADEYQFVGSPLRLDAANMRHEHNYDTFCDPMHDPAKLGSFVDRSGGIMVTGDKLERDGEVPAAHHDITIESRNADSMGCPMSNVHTGSVSEQCLPCPTTTANLHHSSLQVAVDGSLQPTSLGRAPEYQTNTCYISQCPPTLASRQVELASLDGEVGHTVSEVPPIGNLPSGIPLIEQDHAKRESLRLASEAPEEVFESDEEMVRFSDIEAMVLDMDLDPVADDDFSARAESRRTYRRHGRAFLRLEQAASAAMQRSLNAREAFAVLYGRHFKYYITQPEVMMGRATSDNAVDIDLGKEGRANKVSRQQAIIKLKDDGVFYLRNLGRRGLTVNNKAVETGQRAILGSNCLIEVGGMRFIFEFNKKLVKEYIEKRHQQQ